MHYVCVCVRVGACLNSDKLYILHMRRGRRRRRCRRRRLRRRRHRRRRPPTARSIVPVLAACLQNALRSTTLERTYAPPSPPPPPLGCPYFVLSACPVPAGPEPFVLISGEMVLKCERTTACGGRGGVECVPNRGPKSDEVILIISSPTTAMSYTDCI